MYVVLCLEVEATIDKTLINDIKSFGVMISFPNHAVLGLNIFMLQGSNREGSYFEDLVSPS